MAKQTAALHPTTLLLDASPLRHQRSVLIRRSCSAAILPRYSPGLHGVHPWRRRSTTSVEALESFQAYGAPGQQHPRHRVERYHKCTMACHPQSRPLMEHIPEPDIDVRHAGKWHREAKKSWAQTPQRREESGAILRGSSTTLRVHLWRQRGVSSKLEIRPTEHITSITDFHRFQYIFSQPLNLAQGPAEADHPDSTSHWTKYPSIRYCIAYLPTAPKTRARSLHNAAAQRQQHQGKSDKCCSLGSRNVADGSAPRHFHQRFSTGLTFMASMGVWHRDWKPSTIPSWRERESMGVPSINNSLPRIRAAK